MTLKSVSASPCRGLVKLRLDMISYRMFHFSSTILHTHSCMFTSHTCSSVSKILFSIGLPTCFSSKHLATVLKIVDPVQVTVRGFTIQTIHLYCVYCV